MAESTRNLVVLVTHGTDHELSSVAFTIANGGMTAGLKVSVFLTSAGWTWSGSAPWTPPRCPARTSGGAGQGLPGPRRDAVGLHALREGAGLHPGGPHRGRRSSREPARCTSSSRPARRPSASEERRDTMNAVDVKELESEGSGHVPRGGREPRAASFTSRWAGAGRAAGLSGGRPRPHPAPRPSSPSRASATSSTCQRCSPGSAWSIWAAAPAWTASSPRCTWDVRAG